MWCSILEDINPRQNIRDELDRIAAEENTKDETED